jgi:hypothetical protein
MIMGINETNETINHNYNHQFRNHENLRNLTIN